MRGEARRVTYLRLTASPRETNARIRVRAGAPGPLSVYNQSNFKGFEGGCMLDREGFRPNVGIILLNAQQRGVLGQAAA